MPNHARFYKHPVLQGFESRKAGREIYKDEDFIEIQIPGQKNCITQRAVQDADKVEYPAEWNAYEKNAGEANVGSPIGHLPGMSPSKEMELKGLGIYTVEQLVSLSEPGIQKVGHGARALIKTGEQYLGQSSEIDEVKQKNEALAKQIAELTKRMETLAAAEVEKPPKKKRTPAQLANDKRLRNAKNTKGKAA